MAAKQVGERRLGWRVVSSRRARRVWLLPASWLAEIEDWTVEE